MPLANSPTNCQGAHNPNRPTSPIPKPIITHFGTPPSTHSLEPTPPRDGSPSFAANSTRGSSPPPCFSSPIRVCTGKNRPRVDRGSVQSAMAHQLPTHSPTMETSSQAQSPTLSYEPTPPTSDPNPPAQHTHSMRTRSKEGILGPIRGMQT